MELLYHSTRNNAEKITASAAVLKGLADDGGLFVPDKLPKLDISFDELKGMEYRQVAYEVMKLFLTDYTEEELKYCIDSAYDSKFDTEEIVPLTFAGGDYYLELFHGSTIAFKDMALSVLPYLMTTAAKKNHCEDEIVILTATSGDTGKAALAGFADVEGTRICVFYPKNGVSAVQEKQMVTQRGKNVRVIGINGNFDDAQTGVKKMFHDEALREQLKKAGFVFSSANSINIGRLVPQVVYYVYAYTKLLDAGFVKEGAEVNICVPTGNFGNILAAYYAKNLGIPVRKLICASNTNKVLFDFLESGTYDKDREMDDASGAFTGKREFHLTGSPSMDILISSNLERLIYQIGGGDDARCAALMAQLAKEGKYEISAEMKEALKDFVGGYADEQRTAEKIKSLYEATGYIIDTHTAVAAAVAEDYRAKTQDKTLTLLASTASPYKFARTVMTAIDPAYAAKDDFDLIDELSRLSETKVPQAIEDIRSAPVLHDIVCDIEAMPKEVLRFLNI